MAEQIYLAIDLGAASGRVMAGIWNGKGIRLKEIYRFPNGPVLLGDSIRWDVLRLWAEVQHGLALAVEKFGRKVLSIGVDSWGVDFVLLNREDEFLGQPYHYRDARTQGALKLAFRRVPRTEIFRQSGVLPWELNSLYQLLAWQKHSPSLLAEARSLLFIPDFFHWCLSGVKNAEFTVASTSQFLNPVTRDWSRQLLREFGLPTHFLPKIILPGTELGTIRPSLAQRLGLKHLKVVAPPSHDTASAVAGVPTAHTGRSNWAYLSSGTWSILGVELREFSPSPRALSLNVGYEGGLDNTYRLLKNIMGLWLVQQCQRSFAQRGKHLTYEQLQRMAAKAKPMRSLIDVDDQRFFNPPDMPKAIQNFCRETRQPIPNTKGELVRCAYESIALKYREVIGALEELTGEPIEVIHVVGGGSKDRLLNQLTSDACQRPVVAGPVESAAMGNLLVQLRTRGELRSLPEMREISLRSTQPEYYQPSTSYSWKSALGFLTRFYQ